MTPTLDASAQPEPPETDERHRSTARQSMEGFFGRMANEPLMTGIQKPLRTTRGKLMKVLGVGALLVAPATTLIAGGAALGGYAGWKKAREYPVFKQIDKVGSAAVNLGVSAVKAPVVAVKDAALDTVDIATRVAGLPVRLGVKALDTALDIPRDFIEIAEKLPSREKGDSRLIARMLHGVKDLGTGIFSNGWALIKEMGKGAWKHKIISTLTLLGLYGGYASAGSFTGFAQNFAGGINQIIQAFLKALPG